MSRLQLLAAVNTRNVRTTGEVARKLATTESRTSCFLRDAQRSGFVAEEQDQSVFVPPDFDRQFWHLTEAGRHEMYRLEDEALETA